jgi:hypothetical protein
MDKERIIMSKRCVFCGEILNEQGICHNISQHFKPMCLNCKFCNQNSDDTLVCLNENNKLDAIEKIKSSFDSGYEIVDINLAPLPLKEPARKCKRYELNSDILVGTIENILK